MKLKLLLAATALALAPGMAAAMCSWEKTQQSAGQCSAGQVWDAESQSCIVLPSS